MAKSMCLCLFCSLVLVNQNAAAYNDITMTVHFHFYGHSMFQCDNVVKARSIKKWLSEFGRKDLDWPAQSADLTPIKQLEDTWNELATNREPGLITNHLSPILPALIQPGFIISHIWLFCSAPYSLSVYFLHVI